MNNIFANNTDAVERVKTQLVFNVAMNVRQLELASEDWTLGQDKMKSHDRLYVATILYAMNENIGVVEQLKGQGLLNALWLSKPKARGWIMDNLGAIHDLISEKSRFKADRQTIDNQVQALHQQLQPKQEPMADELGDDEALTEGDKAKLKKVAGQK